MYVSDHEYAVNLDPSVKTLLFGASIDIHDAVRYIGGRDEGVRSWSQL